MAHEICRGCGDLKAVEGQGICASCLAEMTGNIIPASNGGDIIDGEYDAIHAEAKKRMQWGRQSYANAFNSADLKADLVEELLDGINYLTFMVARIRRVIPDFHGPLSKQLIRSNGSKT
jgi:hypothetical protein